MTMPRLNNATGPSFVPVAVGGGVVFMPMTFPPLITKHQRRLVPDMCKHGFMFDPTLLRSLRAVIERKTVAAAAEHLGYTPSAISQQLARLRREAGVELLVRHGRYLLPTDAGHR